MAASTGAARTGAVTRDGRGLAARLRTETKVAFKTTEFFSYLAVLAGLLIAGHVIDTGTGTGGDHFPADKVWLYATILTVGYMVSRGLAKSGSSEPYWEDSGQNRARDDRPGDGR
jgi:hypothetical protein